MSSHTHDTKLVHVDATWGGMPYITCGKEGLAKKFKGFTKQPAAGGEKPHAKTREANVPDTQPKSAIEGVPAAERDLGTVRHIIDTLVMLRVKTQGNLTVEEESLMDSLLKDLRLAYVQRSK